MAGDCCSEVGFSGLVTDWSKVVAGRGEGRLWLAKDCSGMTEGGCEVSSGSCRQVSCSECS